MSLEPAAAQYSKTEFGFNLMVAEDNGRFFVDSVPAFDYIPRFDFKRTDFIKISA
jgi:hypothetical protein